MSTAGPLRGHVQPPLRHTYSSAHTLAIGAALHVPAMHSLVPDDVASFKSIASVYSQTGQTVRGFGIVEEPEVDEEKESEDGSQTASEPGDSPGFRIIEALAVGRGKLFKEKNRSWQAFERSASREMDKPMRREHMSSPQVGNAMNNSQLKSPPLDDTTITPPAPPRQNTAIARPSPPPFPVETEKRAEILRRSNHSESLRPIGPRRPTLYGASQGSISLPPTPAPSESRFSSGPYALIRELETLLGPALVSQYIHLPTILGAHDACPDPSSISPSGWAATVFGVPLCTAAGYSSCNTVLGGQPHMLPIVVFTAIEELYRVGLKTPLLLRPGHSSGTPPPSLVAEFDTGPSYGDGLDLSIMPTDRASAPLDDTSALLLCYLNSLPGPILVNALLPSILRFSVRSHTSSNVQAAQILLRLLPTPHFSLLVYLLAFLSQLPMYGEFNAWTMADVAGEFSRVVCGPWEQGEGDEVLEWLLRNWDVLSAGLFPGTAPASASAEDLDGRIAALERQHAAALRAAYEAGAVAERTMWVAEVQALRDAGKAQERIVRRIMRRIVERSPEGRSASYL